MRWVILGAGAVGGTIGARLAGAGHEVVLLARGEHARVMRTDGLRLATPDEVITVRPTIVEEAADLVLQADDLLVLTTKTQDTPALVDVVSDLPVGGPDGPPAATSLPIVCAQNAVENERIALRRFREVTAVCVMLPAVFLEPGRIDAHGTPVSGILEIGRYPEGVDDTTHELVRELSGSGFAATARPKVMPWKYAKLLRNLGNALQALCGIELDPTEESAVAELDRLAKAEGERCLATAGIEVIADGPWEANRGPVMSFGVVEGRARTGGSSWQSVQRKAGSIEADALNGEIVLLGRMIGVPTPVNEILQREANALIRRGGAPGSIRPATLLAAVQQSF